MFFIDISKHTRNHRSSLALSPSKKFESHSERSLLHITRTCDALMTLARIYKIIRYCLDSCRPGVTKAYYAIVKSQICYHSVWNPNVLQKKMFLILSPRDDFLTCLQEDILNCVIWASAPNMFPSIRFAPAYVIANVLHLLATLPATRTLRKYDVVNYFKISLSRSYSLVSQSTSSITISNITCFYTLETQHSLTPFL